MARLNHLLDMSLESEVLGHALPDAILSLIISQFLSLEDISVFDIAICNKNRRLSFLECVKSESCIWPGNKQRDFSCFAMPSCECIIHPRLSWLLSRCMKIRHLLCNGVTHDIAARISEFGNSLHWVSIEDSRMADMSVIKIVRGCPNLMHLYIHH